MSASSNRPSAQPSDAAATPLPDIVGEARRLHSAALEQDLPIRLIGGLAVRLRAGDGMHPSLSREYKDIDFVTPKGRGKAVVEFFSKMQYDPDREFNAFNGGTRLLFHDPTNGRQLDVFVGSFRMCHEIPFADRIALDPSTVPLAELLLTKLQVVALNEKDLRDAIAILHHLDVGDQDGDTINAQRIAQLCAADWGLWRTCTMNLDRIRDGVHLYGLSEVERGLVEHRLARLGEWIDAEPKPRGWRLRDRIGDRKRWYEEPEEVT
ncbi:MAG TPA: hypothetical protein VME22_24445 [Solirubrobacteraceae bacterium]|nr:hypothetical protein [Solirubrobacteraceae bacterium]